MRLSGTVCPVGVWRQAVAAEVVGDLLTCDGDGPTPRERQDNGPNGLLTHILAPGLSNDTVRGRQGMAGWGGPAGGVVVATDAQARAPLLGCVGSLSAQQCLQHYVT
jgi:hypothetical protein